PVPARRLRNRLGRRPAMAVPGLRRRLWPAGRHHGAVDLARLAPTRRHWPGLGGTDRDPSLAGVLAGHASGLAALGCAGAAAAPVLAGVAVCAARGELWAAQPAGPGAGALPAAPVQHAAMPALFVTGTDTGVGKTLVACALVHALRA